MIIAAVVDGHAKPAMHAVHAVALPVAYLPAVQLVGEDAGVKQAAPAGQLVHAVAAVPEKEPRGQLSQVLEDLPGASLHVPAEQFEQAGEALAPVATFHVPGKHGVHDDADIPRALLQVPAAQAVHVAVV